MLICLLQLRETAQIVSAQLDGKLDPQDKDIVQVEVEEFMANIETVRAAVCPPLLCS